MLIGKMRAFIVGPRVFRSFAMNAMAKLQRFVSHGLTENIMPDKIDAVYTKGRIPLQTVQKNESSFFGIHLTSSRV